MEITSVDTDEVARVYLAKFVVRYQRPFLFLHACQDLNLNAHFMV